ncbi:4-hydroxy-tetrahydrodipicolinate reductase [bacterium]|nr:4-hydroxy-tetrahydrodipicolinate reductase [bacterium]
MIKVGVVGALGKMGKEVVKAVLEAEDTTLVMAVDVVGEGTVIANDVKIESDLKQAIQTKKPDVVIDFTQPATIFEHVCLYMNEKVKSVIGTTGLSETQINELKELSKENNTGCLIAPNFSTGAVLMMMFAKQAAKYFNNAEIIELHHNQKKDAPSGTAVKTAQLMAESNPDFTLGNCPETELIKGSRGGTADANIHIHSVRMPGYIASQEVIFGASGQIFKIKHDTMERSCYMAGVLLATRHVFKNNDFIYGLDNIMQ